MNTGSKNNKNEASPEDLPVIDFGAWVERILATNKSSIQALSAESGLLYAYLSRLINSGKKGKPIRPDQATVKQIGEALFKMGLIPDKSGAEIVAAYIPKGYHALPEGEVSINEIIREVDPEAMSIAERYDGLPPAAQGMVKSSLDAAEKMVQQMMREGGVGYSPDED